jgi:dimethylamine corrinoid protein
MDQTEELLETLKTAIVEIDADRAKNIAQQIIAANIDPKRAINSSIREAAEIVGQKFDRAEMFLGELVLVGDLLEELGAMFEQHIPADRLEKKRVIVIATVQGDMHSVGKNLVAVVLRAAGFEVHDLGVDVASSAIIQKAKDVKADMIALSSLLTTTMPYQKEVIDDLASMGLRGNFKVLIGGGPVTRDYAVLIGADGYGRDAFEAIDEVRKLLA